VSSGGSSQPNDQWKYAINEKCTIQNMQKVLLLTVNEEKQNKTKQQQQK